jgi:hypothetical protein
VADTAKDFADAVVALLEDPALCCRFSNGAEFVHKNFSWHENLNHLEQLLLQAAGSCLATTR